MTKTMEISEDEYAAFQAQASFLRAAIYALGGQYEVSFQTLEKHGHGKMEMYGSPDRGSIIVKITLGENEEEPAPYQNQKTSAKVASSAAKILKDPKASTHEKAVAASALTQTAPKGRKRAAG